MHTRNEMIIAQKCVNGVEKEVIMKKEKEIKRIIKRTEPPITPCED